MKRVLLLSAIVGVALAGVFQVELTKIKSKRSRMIADGTWPAYLKYKEFMRMSSGKAQLSQPVNDYSDVEYLGNITLGTPPQQFLVILDTGSANFIVPDSTCAMSFCDGKHKFNSSSSSTYVDKTGLCAVDFGVRGHLGQDTFCFGGIGAMQLCVPNTVVCQEYQLSFGLRGNVADGILGLAFQSLAVDHVVPPLINAINQASFQHLLDQPIFTAWLTRNGPTNGRRGGVFTYGAVDSVNCGPIIAYQPLSSATYWQFRISGISAGSYSSNRVAEVISDTATSFIGGPPSAIDAISRAFNVTLDPNLQAFVLPCSATPPDVVFTIGANNYNINYKDYIIDDGKGHCYLSFAGIASGGFGPSWILGDPFIRSYCNIYDIGQQRIGFALPK